MYKYVTCPECGQRLCRADYGSKVEVSCGKCRAEITAKVDSKGVLHTVAVPEEQTLTTNKKSKD